MADDLTPIPGADSTSAVGADGSVSPMDPMGYDPKKEVSDTKKKFAQWAQQRRPFEGAWFINAAFLRGQQRVQYNDALARLVTPNTAASRIQHSINRVRPKVAARLAKFFKNRPRPVVIPASRENRDILDARATEQFLTYQWYRQHMEEKYRDARSWASVASKGFLWIRFDEKAQAKLRYTPEGGDAPVDEVLPAGDISIEVGGPFEVYPADNTISRLGQQPEFIRAKVRDKQDIEERYGPEFTEGRNAEEQTTSDRTLERLGALTKRPSDHAMHTGGRPDKSNQILVLEHFIAPCGKYPQGRYKVVIGDKIARLDNELPHGFADYPDSPYPVAEICDTITPGQFWNTTLVEQLVDLQREYNYIRNLIVENLRMMARPKIIVYKQHGLARGAWTSMPGEIVELSWMPGLPPPHIIQPASIAGDAWQLLALITREFDDLTLIYPSTVGKSGDASSGYQTNLLQEAADSVHAPDIRADELAIQELAWKMRRLAKLTYTAPRLLAVLGDHNTSEVLAFSQKQIDEFAEVRIQAGSMLPDLKTARMQSVQQMFKDGLFGNPADPATRRRALSQLEMGGIEGIQAEERAPKDEALREEQQLNSGQPVMPATFWQDHMAHLGVHQTELMSSQFQTLPGELKQAKIGHAITHYDFLNPGMALSLRQQYGFDLNSLPMAAPPPPPPPPGAAPGPSGAPPEATPPPPEA